jgi:hypothetical protein
MTMIAARPTLYQSTLFRSRLEARWAAFFDMIEYKWQYEPIDFQDWVPDFLVEFPCGHSECGSWERVGRDGQPEPLRDGSHSFYAEVKPYYTVEEFDGHPVTQNDYGQKYGLNGGMCLGINPSVASAQFSHGAGGGIWSGHDLFGWMGHRDFDALWQCAGNATRWKPPSRTPYQVPGCAVPGCAEKVIDIFTNYCERHSEQR